MATATTYLLQPRVPFEAEYPLTIVDGLMPPVNSPFLFIYETFGEKETYQTDLVERLKASLETFIRNPDQGLVGYPELLGTVYEDPKTTRLTVKVTKSSAVRFSVSNRQDISFLDLRPDQQFPQNCLPAKVFAPGVNTITYNIQDGEPAFCAHLTFVKGGFVLLANKLHFLVDGNGFARFVEEWFKRARELQTKNKTVQNLEGLQIERGQKNKQLLDLELEPTTKQAEALNYVVKPGAKRSMIGCPPFWRPLVTFLGWIVALIARLVPSIPLGFRTQLFHIGPEALKELKHIAQSHTDTRISTNDVVTAFIWRSITRARLGGNANFGKDLGSSKHMGYIDFRKKLEPPLPANYFGNAIQGVFTTIPVEVLLDPTPQALAAVATEGRKSISNFDGSLVRASVQFVASHARAADVKNDLMIFMGKDLWSTTWETMYNSEDALELGVGKFRRVRTPSRNSYDGGYVILPAYGKRDRKQGYKGSTRVDWRS